MKRMGPMIARQLQKHDQPHVQSLAMTRVQVAAWQMTHSPDDAKGRRCWEESVRWRCDDEWKEASVELMKSDPRTTTKWKRPVPGRAAHWERPFAGLLGGA